MERYEPFKRIKTPESFSSLFPRQSEFSAVVYVHYFLLEDDPKFKLYCAPAKTDDSVVPWPENLGAVYDRVVDYGVMTFMFAPEESGDERVQLFNAERSLDGNEAKRDRRLTVVKIRKLLQEIPIYGIFFSRIVSEEYKKHPEEI